MQRLRIPIFSVKSRQCSTSCPDEATAVVLGGGVVGASITYHLAKNGLKNVVLLEKKHLASGTARFARGLINYGHPVPRFKRILSSSIKTYADLGEEVGYDVGFNRCGTLRLATSSQRLSELEKYVARDWIFEEANRKCRSQLVSNERAKELCPLLDPSKVLAALYTEGDGCVDTVKLANALADAATKHGATVLRNCPENKVTFRSDGSWELETDKGTIKTMHLINATGLYARHSAKQHTGLDLPLVLMEHQVAQTTPLAQLKGVQMPVVIDHESTVYLREKDDAILFAAYEKPEYATALEKWAYDKLPDRLTSSTHHLERVAEQMEAAAQLFPALKNATWESKVTVPLSMTADCLPLVGPMLHLKNYWVACGFFDGPAVGGGIGDYLARWIIQGEPPFELHETDPNRFSGWADKKFLVARAKESYSFFFNWSLMPGDRLAGRPTCRVSGVYGALKNNGAQFQFRNGWETPSWYAVDDEPESAAIAREYQRVVNKCGLIDLTYKGKIEIRGADSKVFLDTLLCTDVPDLNMTNQGMMLTPQGKILSFPRIIHHDQSRSEYILVMDPKQEHRDLRWIEDKAKEGDFRVEINSVSEYLSAVGIVGPSCLDVLSEMTNAKLTDDDFPKGTTRLLRLSGNPVIAVKISETGEFGLELYHNRADSLRLYEAIKAAGQMYGIVDFGVKSMNTLRIEKGGLGWGYEITMDTNPFELNLSNLISNKKDFVGKSSLEELSKQEVKRRLCLLEADYIADTDSDKMTIPASLDTVTRPGSDEICGQVTSSCYSYMTQRPLCFAWVLADVQDNEKLSINMGKTSVEAKILGSPPGKVR